MAATKTRMETEGAFVSPASADLINLCRTEGPCISIFLSAHRAGSGSLPSGTVLAGMLPKIAASLAACGVHWQDVEALVEPLGGLGGDPLLLTSHGESLCIYRSPRILHCYLVRAEVEPGWHVEERFVIEPVLAHLDYRQSFLLLALAGKHVKLYRCERGKVETIPIPDGVPESTTEFAHETMPPDPSKNHTMGVRFGSGKGRKEHQHFRQGYMKAIDRGLLSLYRSIGLPLVLAGVEEDTAAYAAVTEFDELLPEPVQTSPDGGATALELMRAAQQVMKRWSNAAERQALAEFRHATPGRRTADNLSILKAALDGRVQHLFIERGGHVAGNAQRVAGRAAEEGYVFRSDDLLNAAAVEVLLHKGMVWLLEPAQMPEPGPMSAVLRYAGEASGK